MVKIGNFFFHYRNFLFPIFYLSLFIPSPSVFGDYRLALALGIVVAFFGQLIRAMTIGLAYIIRGGKNRRVYAEDLVTEGLFSHCRNPLYVGNILMLLGLGLIANSLLYLLIVFPVFIFIYQAIVRAEEDFLLHKFGDAYKAYIRDVNRWIPDPRRLSQTLRSMKFKWKRLVLKEYNTTYIWLLGALLLVGYKTNWITDFQQFAPIFFTILAVTFIYLIVRFLKKTKKLTAE